MTPGSSPSYRPGLGWLVLAFAAIALAPLAPKASAAQTTHTVVIRGMSFIPASLEVKAGDKIVWKNEDVVPHRVFAKKAFDSSSIDAQATWTWVAWQKGTFSYVCNFHPTMGGQLVVK
jgi:plastocyanin